MRPFTTLLATLLAIAMPCSGCNSSDDNPSDPSAADGYRLIWHDEFDAPDGTAPSARAYETPARSRAAWARFISPRKDLMVIQDGVLRMYCRPNNPAADGDTTVMVSGAIQTRNHFSLLHGRIEARIRVDGYPGSFPAFWMMPVKSPGGWPTSGEIDIFESINAQDRAYATLHTGRVAGEDFNTPGYAVDTTIDDWHVYGVEWTSGSISFYLDGVKRGEVTPATIKGGLWPFNEQEFYIILNQSVGMKGGWAMPPDTTHTYLTEVDWVRVYQRPGSTSTGASTSPTPVD